MEDILDNNMKSVEPAARRLFPLLFAFLLLTALPLPTLAGAGGRDAGVSVSSDTYSQTVGSGETAEYTITIYNTGDDAGTFNLVAQTDEQGWSTSLQQTSFYIDSGDSEETLLQVTPPVDAEDDDSAVTTVTASTTGAGPPPEPVDDSLDVTTRVEGSGGLYGVRLSTPSPSKTYQPPNSPVIWVITVENTGQVDETIILSYEDKNCGSGEPLSASLSESQVQVSNDSEEEVEFEVEVPEGAEASEYCYEIKAVVQNDPQQDAEDILDITLNVPEIHECDISINPTSKNLDPNEEGEFSALFENTGNSDWTVSLSASGSKAGWVTTPGGSSRNLPYNDGNGEVQIDFKVTPDDSVSANSGVVITIQGKDSSAVKCAFDITVVVGQSHDASASISPSQLLNVQPGNSKSSTLTVTNKGNGQERFRVDSTSVPSGWGVSLSPNSFELVGKNDNPSSSRTIQVQVNVSVPSDALADDTITITLKVLPQIGGIAYTTVDLSVTVAKVHGLVSVANADDQTGRGGSTVSFPIVVSNPGNVKDTYRLQVKEQSASPAWPTSFRNESGGEITSVEVPPRSSVTVFLAVQVAGEEELDSTKVTFTITNNAATQHKDEHEVRAILSNRNYEMSLMLVDFENDPSSTSATLPPGGSMSVNLWVNNTGDAADEVIFSVSGLASILVARLAWNGSEIEEPLSIQKGERLNITLLIKVGDGVENGIGGNLVISAASTHNAANPSEVRIVMSVLTVHDLRLTAVDRTMANITYPTNAHFEVEVYNAGNTEERVDLSSSAGLRGWQVLIEVDEVTLQPGERRVIEVTVQPPMDTDIEDEFEFTLTASPASAPTVGARHIDLVVKGEQDGGLLPGFSSALTFIAMLGALLVFGRRDN